MCMCMLCACAWGAVTCGTRLCAEGGSHPMHMCTCACILTNMCMHPGARQERALCVHAYYMCAPAAGAATPRVSAAAVDKSRAHTVPTDTMPTAPDSLLPCAFSQCSRPPTPCVVHCVWCRCGVGRYGLGVDMHMALSHRECMHATCMHAMHIHACHACVYIHTCARIHTHRWRWLAHRECALAVRPGIEANGRDRCNATHSVYRDSNGTVALPERVVATGVRVPWHPKHRLREGERELWPESASLEISTVYLGLTCMRSFHMRYACTMPVPEYPPQWLWSRPNATPIMRWTAHGSTWRRSS